MHLREVIWRILISTETLFEAGIDISQQLRFVLLINQSKKVSLR